MANLIRNRRYIYINPINSHLFLGEFICKNKDDWIFHCSESGMNWFLDIKDVLLLPEIGDRIQVVYKESYPVLNRIMENEDVNTIGDFDWSIRQLDGISFIYQKEYFQKDSFSECRISDTYLTDNIRYPLIKIEISYENGDHDLFFVPIEAIEIINKTQSEKEEKRQKAVLVETGKIVRLSERYYIE